MWFSYLIVFYHLVLGIDNSLAGTLLLIGQIADACATPVIGYLCDNTRSRYGRRKIWHLAGSVMVAVSFFFFWHHCLDCQNAPSRLQILYFSSFIVVFQVGWAAVQIAHLALIPELVSNENDRVGLNSIRYGFTIISSVVVYGAMWGLLIRFGVLTEGRINAQDEWIFSGTALGIIGVGLAFTAVFHLFTNEPSTAQQQNTEMARGLSKAWYTWFLSPQFYLVAIIYMTTRLVVNFSQVYTPLYVLDTLLLDKITYLVALIVLAGSLILLYYQKPPNSVGEIVGVYEAMVLLGIGGTILYVTSLSMVADLIGFSVNCGTYYRQLLVFVPAGAALVALVSLVLLAFLLRNAVKSKTDCGFMSNPSINGSEDEESKPLLTQKS
eukprot:Em0009g1167a